LGNPRNSKTLAPNSNVRTALPKQNTEIGLKRHHQIYKNSTTQPTAV